MERIVIEVDEEWKKQLKIDAIENDMSMKEYIIQSVNEKRTRDIQYLIDKSMRR